MKSKAEVILEDVLNMMKDLTAIQRDLLEEQQELGRELRALEIRVYIVESETEALDYCIEALENRGLRKIWSWLSRTAKSVARKLS